MLIKDIKPYPNNGKKHTKKQIQQVANSIKEFGMNQPIVVDKQGIIIVGHGRYEACKLLGIEPEIKVLDISEEKANAYRLADNKLNESEWDMKLVIDELKTLSIPLMELTGFDKDLIIEADEADDIVPETPEEPKSKLGDLYELGRHRVLCGDSTNIGNIDKLMNGKTADMVFTDPPYKMSMGGQGCFTDSTKNIKDRIDNIINFDPTVLEFLPKLDIPSFYICTSKDAIPDYFKIFDGYNFNILVWCKTNPTPFTSGTFLPDIEYIMFFGKKGGYIWNNSLHPTDVYKKYYISNKLDGRKGVGDVHPTMKPVELIQNRIRISSRDAGIVFDLYLGSGSTLIASEKTGRICYGMELDPKYVDVIVQRYVDYTGITEVKKNGIIETWTKTQK